VRIAEKLKEFLPGGYQGYECTDCGIAFAGSEECPSCGETAPVEPTE